MYISISNIKENSVIFDDLVYIHFVVQQISLSTNVQVLSMSLSICNRVYTRVNEDKEMHIHI